MEYFKAKIIGRGEFPVDMLRHDACFPYSSADAATISRSFTDYDNWEVTVAKWGRNWQDDFTVARWNSFGCTVKED